MIEQRKIGNIDGEHCPEDLWRQHLMYVMKGSQGVVRLRSENGFSDLQHLYVNYPLRKGYVQEITTSHTQFLNTEGICYTLIAYYDDVRLCYTLS